MSQFYGTYSCGHEGTVNIFGPTKDRERKAEWEFSGLCPDCYKKKQEEEREKENQKAAEASAEMELPELSGTTKQSAWANTLRINFVDKYNAFLDEFRKRGEKKVYLHDNDGFKVLATEQQLVGLRDWILEHKTDAKYWIDNRLEYLIFYIREALQGMEEEKQAIPDDIQEEIDLEEAALTVKPKEMKKDGVVKISVDGCIIRVKYIQDDEFKKIVKDLGYRWDGIWERKTDEFTGKADDRIAELGHTLLEHGFSVQFPSMITRDAGLNCVFEPECKKWVKFYEPGKLRLTWDGYNDSLYKSAKNLPGASWKNGGMVVAVEFYEKIIEFAEKKEFKISQNASLAIENYKKTEEHFTEYDSEKINSGINKD